MRWGRRTSIEPHETMMARLDLVRCVHRAVCLLLVHEEILGVRCWQKFQGLGTKGLMYRTEKHMARTD